MTPSIVASLEADPLCQEIVLFLLKSETAMDTARGIAQWWVRCDEVAVQAAVDRLISCGILITHTLTSAILYGLTQNREMRAWLRATYGDGAGPTESPPRNLDRHIAEVG